MKIVSSRAKQLGLKEVLYDVDDDIDVLPCRVVTPMRGRVTNVERGLQYFALPAPHKSSLLKRIESRGEGPVVNLTVHDNIHQSSGTHHRQSSTVGLKRDVYLVQKVLLFFTQTFSPPRRTPRRQRGKELNLFCPRV